MSLAAQRWLRAEPDQLGTNPNHALTGVPEPQCTENSGTLPRQGGAWASPVAPDPTSLVYDGEMKITLFACAFLLTSCLSSKPKDSASGCSDLDCNDPACADEPECAEDVEDSAIERDVDGDGYPAEQDCDDDDPAVNPDADEVCDGIDNDCDGSVDQGAIDMGTWYADGDGDGYGDVSTTSEACDPSSGLVADATDCDDADPSVNPGAIELCDGVDNDCSGSVDELEECACDPSENWLVNGNAETGDLSGWTGNATGIVSAMQSGQESAGTVYPYEADWMFSFITAAGGGDSILQSGELPAVSHPIHLAGWFQTEDLGTEQDFGEALLRVYDAEGVQLDVQSTSALTSPSLTWVPLEVMMERPEGAVTWELELTGTLVYGSWVNVFFDAMTLGCGN